MTTLQSTDLRSPRKSEVGSNLTEEPKGILAADMVPLEEFQDDVDEARALVRSGKARLEVVVSPWGLEFNLVAARLVESTPRSA